MERRHRTGFGDAFVDDLPVFRLLVGQQQVLINRLVGLAQTVIDLGRREPRVHPERACLVGDNRDDAFAKALDSQQVLEYTHQRHSGGDFLVTGTVLERLVGVVWRQIRNGELHSAFGHRTAEFLALLSQVLELFGVLTWAHVRRQVTFKLIVGDVQPKAVTEVLEPVRRQLLHLVHGVSSFKVGPERPALDRLRQNHGGRT